MAVTAFRLQNFMAFADTGWIELRPITLLFGKNSSGKSAIIRALRLLRQSLTEAPTGSPFAYFVEDGVDVGDFMTMAHGDDSARYTYFSGEPDWETDKATVGFSFRVDVRPEQVRDFLEQTIEHPWLEIDLHYGFYIEAEDVQEGIAFLKSFALRLLYPNIDLETEPQLIFSADRLPPVWTQELLGQWDYYCDWPHIEYGSDEAPFWRIVEIELSSGFLPKFHMPELAQGEEGLYDAYGKQFKPTLENVVVEIKRFLRSIEYVWPARPEAQRFYMLDDVAQLKWERQGLGTFLRLVTNQLDQKELFAISRWIEALRLGSKIVPQVHSRVGNRAIVTSLAITESDSRTDETNLVDMGYGVAQILPVITQSLLSNRGSVTCIEQPELHLHPGAQAKLADMFIEAAERHAHLLIETHSEHLILRFQRRVRKQQLDVKDVWVAYTTRNQDEGCSYLHRLRMTREGEFLDYWPEGFFPERRVELYDLEDAQDSFGGSD